MQKIPKDIKKLLRNFKHYKVSAELDARILKTLKNARAEMEVMDYKPSFFTLLRGYLSLFNRYVAIPVAMVLIFAGGVFYYTQTSYGYHLNKADSALAKLELAVKGRSYQSAFIPSVMAEGGFIDEALIAKLTVRVFDYTEKAIEIAERIKNPQKLENAFAKINQTQKKEMEVLANATEAVKSEETSMVVAKALKNTAKQEESIDKAVKTAQKAIKEKQKEVKIDIQTSKDFEDEEKKLRDKMINKDIKQQEAIKLQEAKTQYDDAKKALEELEQLKRSIDKDKISKMNTQLDRAEESLKEGKVGRAYGLTTAIEVRSESIMRQEQEDKQKDKEKSDSDKKNKEYKAKEAVGIEPKDTINKQKEPSKTLEKIPVEQDIKTQTRDSGKEAIKEEIKQLINTPEPVRGLSDQNVTTPAANQNNTNNAGQITEPITDTAPAANTDSIKRTPSNTNTSSGTQNTTIDVVPNQTNTISPIIDKETIDPLRLQITPIK